MPIVSQVAQEVALPFLFDLPPNEHAGIHIIELSKNAAKSTQGSKVWQSQHL
jgi:hypothetical protein